MTDQETLDKFNALPKDVHDWLSSLEAAYKIIDLNTRLNLRDARDSVLSDFVFRLVTQDIDPRDFVNALAIELKVSDGAAKSITKLLEEQVLHRIEASLRGVGIDIQLLHFEGDATLQLVPRLEDVVSSTNNESVTNLRMSAQAQTGGKIAPVVPPVSAHTPADHRDIIAPGVWKHVDASAPAGPVILHTEAEATKPMEQTARPIFSVKIPTNKKQYVSAPAALSANVEIPGDAASTNNESVTNLRIKQDGGLQPPMRALSEMKSRETHNAQRETQNVKPENDASRSFEAIKSVAPKSTTSQIYESSANIRTGAPTQTNGAPKIIPVVASTTSQIYESSANIRMEKNIAISRRRVVHYSDWRTLI